jgi:hypothetical protein
LKHVGSKFLARQHAERCSNIDATPAPLCLHQRRRCGKAYLR